MSGLAKLARRMAAAAVLCSIAASAQTLTTARITGSVRDAQDAAIVRGTVTAENLATGEKRSTVSDSSGSFAFTALPPGGYRVTVAAPGFSTAEFPDVRAGISGSTTVNAVLAVAAARAEVQVSGAAPLVNASDAEIGFVLEASALSAMPLPTRNFLQLAALAPGVSMPLTNNSALGRNTPNFSVNGARPSQNRLQINGVDANDISAHDLGSVAIPAPETIGELVIQTSMYDASVSGAGGSVQIITKSGSNALHGSVYEYFRNTALNANDPNLKAVELGRPVLRRNVYGATLGGPIRTGHAFYFVSYQGTRETNGATDDSLYKSVLIAQGLTDDRSESTLLNTFHPVLSDGVTPATSIDRITLQLLNLRLPGGAFLIPTPQQNGRATGTAVSTYREEQFNANFDYRFSQRDSVAAKLFFANAPEFLALGGSTFSGGSGLPGFGTNRQIDNRVLSLQHVHIFSPASVNEARFGYNFIGGRETPQEPIRDSDLGIHRATSNAFPGLPLILLDRGGGAQIGSSFITVQGRSPSLSVADIFSIQQGRHSLRLGGDSRHYQWDAHANAGAYGEIDFPTFNEFLTGSSDFSIIGTGLSDRNFRASDYNLFAQDDWKLSRKFTLNLGLRYELDLPPYDTLGRIGGFDPALYRPRLEVDGDGFPIGPPAGGIVIAGNVVPRYDLAGVPKVGKRILKSIDPNNFGPRIGFAWSPADSGRLVLRGGYGIFYSRPSFIYLGLDFFAPPFYLTSVSFGQTLADPFPNALPTDMFPVIQPGNVLAATIMDRNNHTPYFQHFNTSVEYQLTRDLAVEVAYVGTRGVRLYRRLAINQARIATANHPIINAVAGETITDNTDENAALRAPMQGVDPGLFALNRTDGQSTYHSLQATLNRKLAHGLEFQASYTFSKSMDDASGVGGGAGSDGSVDIGSGLDTGSVLGSQYGSHANRGVSDFDRTHRFVLNYVWDLPKPAFARSPAVRALLSHWQLSGIAIAMSGLPVDISDPAGGSLYGLVGARPNWVPGATREAATRNVPPGYYFNPYAFALATVQPSQAIPSAHDPAAIAPNGGTDVGSAGRNALRGPAQSNLDFSALKQFPAGASRNVELRADVFNLLNHANNSNPVSDIRIAKEVDAAGRIINPGDFGRILGWDSSPRIIQLSLKFTF